MSQVKHKVISKGGSLTIPAEFRREYNAFLGGEAVDLKMEDGKLVVVPHTPKCIFCDSMEGIIKYNGKTVCKGCITSLSKEAGLNG